MFIFFSCVPKDLMKDESGTKTYHQNLAFVMAMKVSFVLLIYSTLNNNPKKKEEKNIFPSQVGFFCPKKYIFKQKKTQKKGKWEMKKKTQKRSVLQCQYKRENEERKWVPEIGFDSNQEHKNVLI